MAEQRADGDAGMAGGGQDPRHRPARLQETPEIPRRALFFELAQNEADRQALVFMLARQEAAKPYFAPPDVPADRLAVLRRAFDATVRDPTLSSRSPPRPASRSTTR